MSCTKKTQDFPGIYKKCLKLEDVAGIDKVTACRLKEAGYCTVKQLKQKAMCMGKCEFINWMRCRFHANSYHAELTFNCLQQQICGDNEEEDICRKKKQSTCQPQCCDDDESDEECC